MSAEELKVVLSALGIILSIVGPLPYIRDTISGKTKPHLVTWLIWTLLASVAFVGQLVGKGGAGAYVLGVTALMNAVILTLSLRRPKAYVTRLDWTLLGAALLILPLWKLTNSPTLSVVLASIIMLIGYTPTLLKSWRAPEHETVSLFAISAIKQALGIMGLATYSVLTVLFPSVLFVANVSLTTIILIRRKRRK